MQHSATYSPEDNKLRLYPAHRLDAEDYAKVKAAGFSWAPNQQIFVAGMWTPIREDLLIELCGEIGDEDTSLVERAEERADRFDGYQARRRQDAERAHDAVKAIADNIPLGQPILVGHHSERHARKDKERIDNGMRKAVKMWETAGYWKARAAGAIAHAKYKERPDVRARRIKTIEADQRKYQRAKDHSLKGLALWSAEGLTLEQARKLAGWTDYGFQCAKRDEPLAYNTHWTAYDVLQPDEKRYQGCPSWTVAQVQEKAREVFPRSVARYDRWIAHFDNRLAYEKAMLEEQGASDLLAPKPRAVLPPILNYRTAAGSIQCANPYKRDTIDTLRQVDMTKAEYAAIYTDYKGARLSLDKSHRFRVAIIKNHERVSVYITDSKDHGEPKATTPAPVEHPAARIPDPPAPTYRAPRQDDPQAALFDNMRQQLKAGGVQVVAAPQLFPTPPDLAARMVDMADIFAHHRVLEPSAGTGTILRAVGSIKEMVAVEINGQLVEGLSRIGLSGLRIRQGDFLECNGDLGTFDRILMNPPFQNGDDIKHIQHARKFLRPGGRLVAICANGPRQREALEPIASEWHDLPAGTFKEQGTMVNTALLVIDA